MPPSLTLEAAVLQLREAAAAALGLLGPVAEVVLRFESGREVPLPVPGAGGGNAPLTPTEAAIVAVLRQAGGPLKSVTIAAKARAVPNKHFLAALSQLQKQGLVTKVKAAGQPPRYQLAG